MKLLPLAVLGLALPLGAVLTGCESAPAAGDQAALGEYVYVNNCQPCHAPDGSGNPANGAPGISGMPDWYVAAQLHKFKTGDRAGSFDDIAGLRMRPMARTLRSDEEVQAVSAHIAAMPLVRLDSHVEGDVEAGKRAYAVCAACHQADGSGNKAMNAPPLAGADGWYVRTQLHNFKAGIRGTDPDDATGASMRPMALGLDDQAMTNLAAYIDTL